MIPLNRRWLEFEGRRLRRLPFLTLLKRATIKATGTALGLLLLPVTAVLHLLGYRHVTIFTDRIGHLALEPDCLLKEEALGRIPRRRWIMLAPPSRTANEHLLTYWDSRILIVRDRLACFLIGHMSRWGLMRHDAAPYVRTIGKAQTAYSIFAAWRERDPLLVLSAQDEAWGADSLADLGVPRDAWFVCVHVREGGFSPEDEELHSHRNAEVANILAATTEIVRRGGWVIRLGDPTMAPLPQRPHVVDYAHHPLKSDRLDIVLCAKARFILGNTSGIALVATVFGVPCALANMVPIAALGVGLRDISIPKLHWSMREGRHLRFAELFASPLSRAQYARDFADADIRVEENSADDIRDLAIEMLDRLEGKTPGSDSACLQHAFLSLLRVDHYSWGAGSTVGAHFMLRYRRLFETEDKINGLNSPSLT